MVLYSLNLIAYYRYDCNGTPDVLYVNMTTLLLWKRRWMWTVLLKVWHERVHRDPAHQWRSVRYAWKLANYLISDINFIDIFNKANAL